MLIQDNVNYIIIGEPCQLPKGIIFCFKAKLSIRKSVRIYCNKKAAQAFLSMNNK
jgi:hypothetical protein